MRRAPPEALLLAGFFSLVVLVAVTGFAVRSWRPEVISAHGDGIDAMIRYLLLTTGVVFVVGHVVLLVFLLRYGRGADTPPATLSVRKEWLWALLPVLAMTAVAEGGVLLIGLPVWGQIYSAPPPDTLEVEVVGKQFEWLARYAGKDGVFGRTDPSLVDDAKNPLGLDRKDGAARDDIVLRGELHLPAGRHAVIRLRSHDVLHSFTVPAARVKQDVVPGFLARTQFRPEKTGRFEIACAELCGLGHYRMRGWLIVDDPAGFEKWLSEQIPWLQ